MKALLPMTSRLLRDDSAVVSIVLAGTMLITIGTTGLAVDLGRGEFVKVELQSALDAGGLAGGRVFNTSATQMVTEATAYFGANWVGPFASTLVAPSPTYTPNANLTQMTGVASVTMKTTMLWAVGIPTMTADASNLVDTPTQSGGIELAMVLDNTGSESQGCKMNYLVAAAQGMINQLYGVPNPTTTNVVQPPGSSNCTSTEQYTIPTYAKPAEVTPPKFFWTSIIPFITQVAPVVAGSTDMINWVSNGYVDTKHATEYPSSDPWNGCVEARLYSAAGDTTKDPYGGEDAVATTVKVANGNFNGNTLYGTEIDPTTAPFTRYFYPSDNDTAQRSENPVDTNLAAPSGHPTPVGEPNAPFWPAFNVWSNSQEGTAPGFNDVTSGLGSNTTILATGRNATVTTQNETTSAFTNPTGDPVPRSPIGIPSNYTYKMGPNLGCPSPMTVMTSDYPTIMQNIAAMFPAPVGGTATNLGLSWGFRVLSPNWQGIWTAGSSANNNGVTLPLPYNTTLTDPTTQARIAMTKVVIFMTDGNNQWYSGDGTNSYTAYKTLDHTPLFDQTTSNPWTSTSLAAGGKIVPPQQTIGSGSKMATRAVNAATATPPAGTNSWTTDAWAICDAMQADGIVMYTILLEFNLSDINTTTSTGYQNHCATDSAAGTHFFELTGSNVSQLGSVFTAIGNSLSELRLAQ